MRVRAIKRGFVGGQYRRPGDAFDIEPSEFSENWMKKVSTGTESKAVKPPKYVPLEIPDLIEKEKAKAKAKPKAKQSKKASE